MKRSLTLRLTLMCFTAMLCVILALTAGIVYVELNSSRDDAKATIDPVFAHVVALLNAELREGKTISAAAPSAWDRAGRPEMYMLVAYDASSGVRPAYVSAPTPTSLLNDVPYNYVVPDGLYRKANLPHGNVFLYVSNLYIHTTLLKALVRLLPFQLVAIAIAAGLSWFIAQRATMPLRDLAADLKSFGRGDLIARDLSGSRDVEMTGLYSSYNDAVENARKALSERAAANENMRIFISDAGHELKTPLTIIMGYIDALAEGLVSRAEDRQQILSKTLTECRRMRGNIGKLISLARLDQEEPNIGTVDVAAIVRDVGDSMRALASQLTIEAPTNGAAIAVGNAEEIREAIVVVVDNAIKYGNGCPIDISVSRNADVVAVKIADSGPGMSAEERVRAFDRFYRGSAAASVIGTGLGLAVAKRAVERANGTITLNSEVGRGTAVTFYLRGVPSESKKHPSPSTQINYNY